MDYPSCCGVASRSCAPRSVSTTEAKTSSSIPANVPVRHLTVLTKIDLAEAVEFDRAAAHAAIHAVRPGMPTLETWHAPAKGSTPGWLG